MELGKVSRSIAMSSTPSISHKLREKLIFTLHRLHQTKKTYSQLKSEVVKGLGEAKDVFTNISIPLLRLVDLKVEEMEKDGRKTVVFTNNFEMLGEFGVESETFQSVLSSTQKLLQRSEGESFKDKAAYHTDQILYTIKCQVKQLMLLLKTIESLVRSQERDLIQRFEDHQGFVKRMQDKFVSETMRLHQQVQNMKENAFSNADQDSLNPSILEQGYKALLSIVLKLQKAVFDGFRKGLGELKEEMEGMIDDLASHMCQPLLSYMKRLSSEGIMSLVRQLQSLVEQMETNFVQHLPALMAANNRLLLQVRNSEILLKERENKLQKMGMSLKNALLKRGEETEEFRKRMKTQFKRIQDLEKDVKEMKAERLEDKQALCAKDRQIMLQRDEALQKAENFDRQLSMLREENLLLKKSSQNKNTISSEIFTTDKRATNSINEMWPNRGAQKFSKPKTATDILWPNDNRISSILQAKKDGYTLHHRVSREKEEKFGDDFLWDILEKRQKAGIGCLNSLNSNSRRAENGTSAKTSLPTQLADYSFQHSSLNLDEGGAFMRGNSPKVPFHREQGPITRNFARRMLETPPSQKPSPSRNLPYNLRSNHGVLGKRDSPNSLPLFSPWRK
ncbi:hypothetical protein SUGI_0937120 [Cryptomeria japonica]|uniref:uncharacterized protein LOC131026778 n=1 Tax=Cryptomeria japonica TaxID=3369 RepID=UPI002414B833|nr:uncharacterized protein LOC131026778 [Cryptomeria japonica]GLJ44587.1 hypothetical protein SUGI_0937120 [Cryptomeria japonica]